MRLLYELNPSFHSGVSFVGVFILCSPDIVRKRTLSTTQVNLYSNRAMARNRAMPVSAFSTACDEATCAQLIERRLDGLTLQGCDWMSELFIA